MPIYDLSVSMVDAFKRRTTRLYQINESTFLDAQGAAGAFVNDLGDITEMRILKSTLSESTPIVDIAEAGANVDRGLTVNWELATFPGKQAVSKVPSPPIDLFDSEGRLDLADARFTAWASHFLSNTVLVSDGETVAAVLGGRLDK